MVLVLVRQEDRGERRRVDAGRLQPLREIARAEARRRSGCATPSPSTSVALPVLPDPRTRKRRLTRRRSGRSARSRSRGRRRSGPTSGSPGSDGRTGSGSSSRRDGRRSSRTPPRGRCRPGRRSRRWSSVRRVCSWPDAMSLTTISSTSNRPPMPAVSATVIVGSSERKQLGGCGCPGSMLRTTEAHRHRRRRHVQVDDRGRGDRRAFLAGREPECQHYRQDRATHGPHHIRLVAD